MTRIPSLPRRRAARAARRRDVRRRARARRRSESLTAAHARRVCRARHAPAPTLIRTLFRRAQFDPAAARSSPLTVRPRPRSFPRRPAIRNRARRCRIGSRPSRKNNSSPSRRSPVALSRSARPPAGTQACAGDRPAPAARAVESGRRAEEGPHRHHSARWKRRERQAGGHGAASGAGTGRAAQPPTARPPPAPHRRGGAGPAARSSGAPISLDPAGSGRPRCRRGGAARAAPAIPRARAGERGEPDGYVVQLSSQKSESEAQSSFRSAAGQVPQRARQPPADHSARGSGQQGRFLPHHDRAVRIGPGGRASSARTTRPPAASASFLTTELACLACAG